MQGSRHLRVLGCLALCTAMGRVPCEAGPLYAFTSDRDGESDIFVVDQDGGVRNVTRVSFGDYPPYWGCAAPEWSPDGARIVFTLNMPAGTEMRDEKEIHVIDADGSNMMRLTYSPSYDWEASWSPDGSRLLFTSFRDGDSEIYLMNPDGSGQQNLTNSPTHEDMPAWSPDGTQVLFRSDRTGLLTVYLMSPDGFDLRMIPGLPETTRCPCWSPDGTRIAFATWTDICIVDLDGTELDRFTPGLTRPCGLDWSPDGRELGFHVSEGTGHYDIYTLSVATGAVRRVTDRRGWDLSLCWYPSAGLASLARPSSWAAIKRLVR